MFDPAKLRRRAPTSGVLIAALTLLSPPLAGQEREGPDRTTHPPGTETSPLGELGHVERRGHGPVELLLVPGAGFGWRAWQPFMERNLDRFTMWAVTPPGYDGTRPPPMPDPYVLDERPWSDALIRALARLAEEEMEHPVVVGHHVLGDYYAMRLALEHPDVVAGVVVMGGMPTRPALVRPDSGPPRPADVREKVEDSGRRLLPMMRFQTREQWRENAMAPELLSTDPDRGRALFRRQVSAPVETQLRYFMEWSSSQITDRLAELTVPMLVVFPLRYRDWNELLRLNEAMLTERFGSLEQARAALEERFGSLQEAQRRMSPLGRWEGLSDPPEDLQIRIVQPSGVFVMDDRPEEVERILADWLQEKIQPSS